MPWVHLHADTTGKVKACCSTSVTYGDLAHQSVSDIWEGESIKAFRQQVLVQGVDRRCSSCLHREQAGKESMRTETIAKYPELSRQIVNEQTVTSQLKPVYLDIRFSNVCNLRCRTCWHGASSSWFEEGKQLNNTAGNQAIIRATTNNRQLVTDVMNYCEAIDEVYFAGGEPLMMEEHYQLLDSLLATKQQPLIRYNTNLSLLQCKAYDACDYWRQFDRVKVSVSIDELAQRGEYVRKGLKWELLLKNIEQVQVKCPHVAIEIAPTVSVFNVARLGEVHRYFVDRQIIAVSNVYLNVLDRPSAYNIVHLDEEAKREAKEHLTAHIAWLASVDADATLIDEFKSLIEYMYARVANPKFQQHFAQMTQQLDGMRKEDYTAIFEKSFQK
ncbi:twitch domain-containing radical SAM protein [Reichenbachiella agariperforans]|uniref:twitch domain-containing radical SAM protein n=1 Tax=Reichenbachiella agariperforans TaxID=156994 RepID=UPI001C0816EC|nr:twitch domain-containing radical SAM protein [Reichenbachiella agariperforans]MBU2914595.1 twitch domain-containing radical SAM protein [Reichenbachiella agariperforans]